MNAIFIIVLGGVIFILLEKLFPHHPLPKKDGWFLRSVSVNVIQFLIVTLGGELWESFMLSHSSSPLNLYERLEEWTTYSAIVGGLIAYFVTTFVFYWWHRVRHENRVLWLMLHQFHHSPERLEVITSFYKHPLEIFCNSVIMGVIVYIILGLKNRQKISFMKF